MELVSITILGISIIGIVSLLLASREEMNTIKSFKEIQVWRKDAIWRYE